MTVAMMSNWPSRLAATIGWLQDHLQNRTREIGREFLVVDDDLAGAGLHPDAGDRVLALAGGVGAALLVELLDMHRRRGLSRGDGGAAEFG